MLLSAARRWCCGFVPYELQVRAQLHCYSSRKATQIQAIGGCVFGTGASHQAGRLRCISARYVARSWQPPARPPRWATTPRCKGSPLQESCIDRRHPNPVALNSRLGLSHLEGKQAPNPRTAGLVVSSVCHPDHHHHAHRAAQAAETRKYSHPERLEEAPSVLQ